MVKNLSEIRDMFDKSKYPENEQGYSIVPVNDIHDALYQTFAAGEHSYRVTQAGSLSNGKNYVCIELTVLIDGEKHTVPGAADGNRGIAGLIQSALRNAVMRGLGMGASFYPDDEPLELSHSEPSQPSYTPRGNTSGGSYQKRSYDSSAPKKDYGPWTGMDRNGNPLKIKSGKLEGEAWVDLSDKLIQQMADNNNEIAQKELARRMESQGHGNQSGNSRPTNVFR